MALINKLKAIGDAIREKTKTTDLLKLDEMPDAILSISDGAKNYLPNKAVSETKGNLTLTVNEDKSLNLSGYSASNVIFTLFDKDRDGGTFTIPQGYYGCSIVAGGLYNISVTFRKGESFNIYNLSLLMDYLERNDVEVESVKLDVSRTTGIINIDIKPGIYEYVPWE